MYKRPDPKKPTKIHPIEAEFGAYGFINTSNDPAWISPHVQELMDDGRFALSQFSSAIDSAKALKMNDYKPEVAAAKKRELILKAKRALMGFLKKHIEKYKSEVNAVGNMILRQTEPETFSDPTKALLAELRNQEIRNIVRNTDPKHRDDLIKDNLEFIKALVGSPDDIINKDHLTEIRREFAFKVDPSLANQEKDQKEIYKMVRSRAADLSATSAKMLLYSKIDDPLPPQEFYETFPPQSEHEKEMVSNRIQQWDRQQVKIEQTKEFEKKNEGLNFEAGERAARIDRGIQH